MIYVFYILAAALLWFSYRSFFGGIAYLNYFKKELAKPVSAYCPSATVIAPCKGLDEGLADNLAALFEQDYPKYEVIFVVEGEADAAVPVIERVSSRDAEPPNEESSATRRLCGRIPDATKIVVADKAKASSQKVENLREAVLQADDKSEVFVFVDSDARPSKDWLRSLAAPLEDETVGAATGYRWFISKTPTFASELRGMWNASIASALGPNEKSNFCWGGSMAIRRETFERLGIRDRWRLVVSDDFTVTRAMNEAGLRIVFVPKALTASVEDCTLRQLFEFTNRQMKITRVYASNLWLMSFFGSGLFCVTMVLAFAIIIFSKTNSLHVLLAIAMIFVVGGLSVAKSVLRLKAAKLVLSDYSPTISRQFLSHSVLWIAAPFLFLYNCAVALLSRKIAWRGTGYLMRSASETVVYNAPTNKTDQ